VAGDELLFFGGGGDPGRDGGGLIESVLFFVAIVFAVHGRHAGGAFAPSNANDNLLYESGAIEALASFLPLLAVVLREMSRGAGDGEFGLHLLFFAALEAVEVLQDTFQGALGGGL